MKRFERKYFLMHMCFALCLIFGIAALASAILIQDSVLGISTVVGFGVLEFIFAKFAIDMHREFRVIVKDLDWPE